MASILAPRSRASGRAGPRAAPRPPHALPGWPLGRSTLRASRPMLPAPAPRWHARPLLLIAARRLGAAYSGQVKSSEYALGESAAVPTAIVLANRNYMNLLELPLLFYVACLMAFMTVNTSSTLLTLAWVYVALRVLHSLIHVSYNRVLHRFIVFAASNFVLVFIWLYLARSLLSQS